MPRHKKTLAQVAQEEDEKVAQGREAEGYVRVPGSVGKVGHVVMLHFSSEEFRILNELAEGRGMNVDQYLRESALARQND